MLSLEWAPSLLPTFPLASASHGVKGRLTPSGLVWKHSCSLLCLFSAWFGQSLHHVYRPLGCTVSNHRFYPRYNLKHRCASFPLWTAWSSPDGYTLLMQGKNREYFSNSLSYVGNFWVQGLRPTALLRGCSDRTVESSALGCIWPSTFPQASLASVGLSHSHILETPILPKSHL